jgi:hypothetical protein
MSAEALREILAFSAFALFTLAGFTTYWVRVRARQFKGDLEKKLARLERASAENAQRIEDLETIIVSQARSLLKESERSELDRDVRLAASRPHDVVAPEGIDRQRAAELARRLRG